MKKIFTLIVALLAMGGCAFAQDDFSVFENFDSYAAGKSMPCINNPMGMTSTTYNVSVMEDPINPETNKALRIVYDPDEAGDCIKIPVIQVKLGEGETVADITRFEFDFYCYQYPSGYYDDDIVNEYLAEHPDADSSIFNNSSSYNFMYYFMPATSSWYQDTDPYQIDSGMHAVDYHNYSLKNVWIDHCGWDVADVPEASLDLNEFYFAFGQWGRQVYWFADNLTFYGVSGAVGTSIGTIEVDKTGNVKGFYNVAGQKLSEAPAKGLYIQDGKKVIAQ